MRRMLRATDGMRLALLLAAGAALTLVPGLGQTPPDPREQLQQLLLTQEELIERLEDDGWVIKTVDRLDPEPPGGISAVATYANPNTLTSLVVGLIEFEAREPLDGFVAANLEARQVQGEPRDLRAEAQENPDVLPELLLQETERVLLLTLERDQLQLLFQRHTLLAFLRVAQTEGAVTTVEEKEALLLRVAERQLQKILDFCAQLAEEGAEAPTYCAPLGG